MGAAAKAAELSFVCGNQPERNWGTYFSITASTSDFKTLKAHSFGWVEGSRQAMEAEPVNTVEEVVFKANAKLAATSREWRDAIPFDVSTKQFGQAVFYLHKEKFAASQENIVARIKIRHFETGKQLDLRLPCGYSVK